MVCLVFAVLCCGNGTVGVFAKALTITIRIRTSLGFADEELLTTHTKDENA